jgi:hypothetical protein
VSLISSDKKISDGDDRNGVSDLVYVHCDFVLGRFEASNGIRLRALVLGCHALLGCPTHCPWQGRFGFRVRVPILVSPSYTNEHSSLLTVFATGGKTLMTWKAYVSTECARS